MYRSLRDVALWVSLINISVFIPASWLVQGIIEETHTLRKEVDELQQDLHKLELHLSENYIRK